MGLKILFEIGLGIVQGHSGLLEEGMHVHPGLEAKEPPHLALCEGFRPLILKGDSL
jgi:hypothetical protein